MNDGTASHMERMQQLALQKFQEVLRETIAHAWKPEHGHPPRCGYIEQKVFSQKPWLNSIGIHAWYITPSETMALTAPGRPSTKSKIDGMFFDLLVGHFGVSTDRTRLAVHWQIGPRFGRGFLCAIKHDEGGAVWLERGRLLWVS